MTVDWDAPRWLALAPLAWGLLAWWHARSTHPMPPGRKRAVLAARATGVTLALLALAGPALRQATDEQAVVFVLDHSRSQGTAGRRAGRERAAKLAAALPEGTVWGVLSAGESTRVVRAPARDREFPALVEEWLERDGAASDLAAAVELARGLFPPATGRRIVLVTDGVQTRGDLEEAAREATLAGVAIDAVPVAGEPRPDVRVLRLTPSRARAHEGASVSLAAEVESTLAGTGRLRLFENGVEVESRALTVAPGRVAVEVFRREPDARGLYTYQVRVEGFSGDALPENDAALALVDVHGRPVLLYVEGAEGEARFLADAMAREGIRLHARPPHGIPESVQDLAGYDGVVLSDVPARNVSEKAMTALRDWVERLGGGLVVIGGTNSFGVGGWHRTPIEEVLPVKIRAPDQEERPATALALVIDRSGSMQGHKIEICKSAAIATVEVLSRKDWVGVVAFDSDAHWVVPMTRVGAGAAIAGQIAGLSAGGGTHIHPGMTAARDALARVAARVKHMIVLTDGQTMGGGYAELAAALRSQGVTVSAVGVGDGADTALLQAIATSGGGKYYFSDDASAVPRIFTQDAMRHLGRMVREEAFTPRQIEDHPMLAGWPAAEAPQLLGYVKTTRRATAQVPLVTDLDDPLLAHWRFGLGKVTAFTSDCTSRWAALWVAGWPGYAQFWSQVLRETAREPQGRTLDLRLEERGAEARITVDALEDPAHFRNDAAMEAEVFFVPASDPGTPLRPLASPAIDQRGPGCYEGRFPLDRAGLYLVRVRSGAEWVSAGLVRNVSHEAAGGRVDRTLLARVCALGGGALLEAEDATVPRGREAHARFGDLSPWLLRLLLIVFLVDLALRRWENVLGIAEWLGVRAVGSPAPSLDTRTRPE